MNINDCFGSYLKAEDVGSGQLGLTIRACELRDIKDRDGTSERKPVLMFHESDKSLVINVTNGQTLASLLGNETNHWTGRKIVLGTQPTQMGPGIRVIGLANHGQQAPQQQNYSAPPQFNPSQTQQAQDLFGGRPAPSPLGSQPTQNGYQAPPQQADSVPF